MSGRTVVYLTPEGFQALEKELAFLTTVRRQEVAARLHGALSEGELIENAELEEARREQAFLEGRIIEVEEQLRKAEIISKTEDNDGIVHLGDTVLVREEGVDTDEEYLMVGSAEADPRNGRISNESPLGRALIGKRVGEKAVVRAPDGDIVFKIISSS
ncbi:MAG: transcription elongation factor GreA [Anaerolineae bacterium]|nr:transcription elongation factor GreA [Anaerolineae bacterium]